jgi:uncharacterized protein DUF6701
VSREQEPNVRRLAKLLLLLAALAGSAFAPAALAANCASIASGAWNVQTTWGAAGTGCVGAVGGIPGAVDNVTISDNTLVSVNAPAFSKTITMSLASTGSNGLVILVGTTLTNSTDFTMSGGVAGKASTVDMGTGTLNSGGVSINSNAGTSIFSVGSGTLNLNPAANITITGNAAPASASVLVGTGTINASSINFGAAGVAADQALKSTGASTINLTGNLGNGGTLTTSGTGTINFKGAVAQTIGVYATYNNIAINNTGGGVSFSGAATVGGTLTVNTGTLTSNAGALTVTGATTVNSTFSIGNAITQTGATTVNGTLNITAAGGAKTFVGNVTVNAGGTWNNSGNSTATFEGGITNNGNPFAAGTGEQTFSTNSQTLAGTGAINFGGAIQLCLVAVASPASCTGAITVTNNNTNAVTVPGDIIGPTVFSTWVQGPNSTLNCGGPTGCTIFQTNLTASAVGNTVNYNSTLPPRNVILPTGAAHAYYNLILGGSGAHTMPASAMTILNNLTMATTGTATAMGALTIGGNLTIGAGTTFDGGLAFSHTITGNISNSGTFTADTSSYTVGGNFTNAASGSFVQTTGAFSVAGNLINSAAIPGKFATGTGPFSLAGNFTNNGTFTSGTGMFTFNGTLAQTFTGTAGGSTTFNFATLNNAQGLSMTGTHNLRVGAPPPSPPPGSCSVNAVVQAPVLTLTAGQINTGSNIVIISNNSAITGAGVTTAGVTAFIAGNLQKQFTLATNETRTFEVGTGNTYAPLNIFLACVNNTGTLTVSTTAGDHPQIATSPINSFASVNRYWTIASLGAAANWFTPSATDTFTFNYAASDVDPAPTNPATFLVAAYYGAAGWSTAFTPSSSSATSTVLTGTAITPNNLAGAYQIGNGGPSIPPPGGFNAFESSTVAGAVNGRIYTKLAGTGFSLDVIAILAGAQESTFTNSVNVSLVANTTGSALNANNCPVVSTPVQGPTSVIISGGRSTIVFGAVATAYRDVRVMVQYPTVAPTVTSCSADDFAIRPTSFTVTTTTATQAGTSGLPIIKAGSAFDLSAASIAGYDGAPTIDPTKVVGSPVAGVIGGTFSAAPIGTGTATGAAFTYSEVGNFGLSINAVYDSSFTAVDQPIGLPPDCTLDFSNSLVAGQYGCSFGNTVAIPAGGGFAGFGRFVPHHFDIAQNIPTIVPACAVGPLNPFTYVGQTFTYGNAPAITVTASNAADAPTRNYAGAYMYLTNASLVNGVAGNGLYATQAKRYTVFPALAVNMPAFNSASPPLPAPGVDPTIVFPAAGTPTAGVGGLTFSAGTGFNFIRNPAAPSVNFTADIALSLDIVDADGVQYVNPVLPAPPDPALVSFGSIATAGNGMAFSPAAGNNMYYGRMLVTNLSGSELLPLQETVTMQYFSGSGFVTNMADNCTTVAAADVGRGNFQGTLTAAQATPTFPNGNTFANGTNILRFSAPGAGRTGAFDFVIDLGAAAPNVPVTCAAIPGPVPGANAPFLRDKQSCSGGAYSQDPTAHATFGVYNLSPNSIYMRENY